MDQGDTQANVSINIDLEGAVADEKRSPVEDVTASLEMGGSDLVDVPVICEGQGLGQLGVGDLSVTVGQLNLGEFAGSEVDLSESPEQQDEEKDGEDENGGDVPLEGDTQEGQTIHYEEEGVDIEQNQPGDLLTFSPSSESESFPDMDQQAGNLTEQTADGVGVSDQIKEDTAGDIQPAPLEDPEPQPEQNTDPSPQQDSQETSEPVDIQTKSKTDDGFETLIVGSPECSLTEQELPSEKVDESNVRKFFADEVVNSGDIEGKNFFDSFTTGGVDSLTDSTASVTSHRSGSFSQVETARRSGSFSQVETSSPTSKDSHHSIPTTPPINEVFTSHSPVATSPPISEVRTRHASVPTTPPINDVFTSQAPPVSSPQIASRPPFLSSSSLDNEDPFAAALKMSDIDRRYNAWIPSESTRQILVAKVMSPSSVLLDSSQYTMPGVVVEDSQGDPIKDLVYKFMGEQESNKRQMLTADNVSQNEEGLQQLIAGGCYRSAVDLTARLLDRFNQGNGALGKPTLNTPLTLQIWCTRIALMMKLRLFGTAEVEIEAFGNLDQPDLFYEFYQETYPGKRGSMVPFSFRMLHAELPQYNGRPQDTIDRLYYLHAITSKIISNLENGLAEDGSGIEMSEDNRKGSIELWKSRLVRILYSIGNCLALMKDYNQACMVYKELLEKDTENGIPIWSGMGRIHLQLGDLKSAENCFQEVEKLASTDKEKAQTFMNKGFYWLAQSNYDEARVNFEEVLKLDPDNALAINNMAVCLLYVGKLKEALRTIENLVHKDPKFLQEGVLFNLCTIYELESSRSMNKKQALLDLVNKSHGDGFNVQCLKMI